MASETITGATGKSEKHANNPKSFIRNYPELWCEKQKSPINIKCTFKCHYIKLTISLNILMSVNSKQGLVE